MPVYSSDGQRRLVHFDSLREYPVEVEAFDPALVQTRLVDRRAQFDPDPDDTQQLVEEWFARLRRRVPYPRWPDELRRLLAYWSSRDCALPANYVRQLERWIRQCQEIAAARAERALLAVDRPAEAPYPNDTTRRIHLRVSCAPATLSEAATSGSSPTQQVVKVSTGAIAKSQKPSWWQRTKTKLYWLGQMLIGRREGPDGKPQPYPWSPFREWANDAEKIPFNPVPADAIASAAEGDLRPAVKEGALRVVTGGLGKYRKGPKTVLRVADDVGDTSTFFRPEQITQGPNFLSKVRKHIDQVRRRGETVEEIPSPARGGAQRVWTIIQERVSRGGGRQTTFSGESAVAFEDGGVTYIFRGNGQFWTILKND